MAMTKAERGAEIAHLKAQLAEDAIEALIRIGTGINVAALELKDVAIPARTVIAALLIYQTRLSETVAQIKRVA